MKARPPNQKESKAKVSARAGTAPAKKLRIVLADDHVMFRDGIGAVIRSQADMEVAGEAAGGAEALRKVADLQPDLLVMDISMPELNGVQVMQKLKQTASATRVLVLTAFGQRAYMRQLLAAGAAGYVLKQASSEVLLTAIRTVATGAAYLDPAVTSKVVSTFVAQKRLPGSSEGRELSEREREVLRHVAQGYSNKEIAGQFDISVKTVESHKANFMDKLGLRTRAEIVRFALHQGWLDDSSPHS